MRFVIFVNGLALILASILMFATALMFPDTVQNFSEAGLLTAFLGIAVALSSSTQLGEIRHIHAFLLTTSVWITAAVAGALPLWLWSMSPVDAFFESMSGITTTGSTVMTGLDSTPRGILLWRSILQAMGGVGFVVTGIALLPFLKVGGMQLFRTESSDKGEKELSNATRFATATLAVYLSLMMLCFIAYSVGGMSFFDAALHAMSTLSTGGYSSHDASFGFFTSPFLQWSGTLFMLLGSIPFAWYIRGARRGSFRSEQVSAMLMTLTLVIVPLSIWLAAFDKVPLFEALRLVAFNVISVVSTTGFATTDYTQWGPLAVVVFFVLTAVGGCTGSTAGGGKAMRWIIMARMIRQQLIHIRYPSSVTVVEYEGRAVGEDVMNGVVAFFIFFALTVGILGMVLNQLGLDISTAISAALTAVANVGPGVGPIVGPAGNFVSLTDPAKLVLVFGMFVGRLEMLTVYVLLTAAFWREV